MAFFAVRCCSLISNLFTRCDVCRSYLYDALSILYIVLCMMCIIFLFYLILILTFKPFITASMFIEYICFSLKTCQGHQFCNQ